MSAKIKKLIFMVLILAVGTLLGTGVTLTIISEDEQQTIEIETVVKVPTPVLKLSEDQLPAQIESDQGEIIEEIYPTVEEVDGGQFEDKFSGISVVNTPSYEDLGWSETYDVSSPEAFRNDTLGKCIIANNIYGAQCVSLARVYWWSYADRDVSTCGTGAAKGMMNCAEENAGEEFIILPEDSTIQAGDWLVFTGGLYGHVGMALGPVTNGYVALLGENQGGADCGAGIGGSATNIINISMKNFIGGYRPKAYVKVEPTTPQPEELPETAF